MDDIYFTDKKGRPDGSHSRTPQKDRFKESAYKDLHTSPELKKRAKDPVIPPRKGKFTVNIPDDAEVKSPVDRTPKGERRTSPQPYSRTPAGKRVEVPETAKHRAPARPAAPTPAPVPPSRDPKGKPMNDKPKKKKNIVPALIATFAIFLVVLIVGLVGYGYSILGELNYDDSIVENEYVSDLAKSPDVKNILLIGSDAREGDGTTGQRSDSMILFSIDEKNKKIKLTSFLRDSYVFIPGEGYEDKLNASFSYGGPQLTMDTLEYNFGIDIDSYVIIDFTIFTEFIDLLGGITIEGVTENEVDYMLNTLQFLGTKVGTNHLNGIRALWYCRMRYLDDDFHRTERQRKVIGAVIKQVAKTNPVTLLDIVKQVIPNISTNITQSELLSLGANAALKYLRYDIVQQQIPAEDTWWNDDIDGASVIVFNIEKNAQILQEFIFGEYKQVVTTTEEEEDYYYDDEEYYDEDYDYYY